MDLFANQDLWSNTGIAAQNYYPSAAEDFNWSDLEDIPPLTPFDNSRWNNIQQTWSHTNLRSQGIEDTFNNFPSTVSMFYRNDEYSDISLSPPTNQQDDISLSPPTNQQDDISLSPPTNQQDDISLFPPSNQQDEERDKSLPPKKRRRVHEIDFSAEVEPYINLNPELPEDVVTSRIPNPTFVRYCTVKAVIVGMNNFRGEVEAGEEVFLIKDGSSKTSIVITNRYGAEVGYLKSEVASILSPLRDKKVIGIEGTATNGSKNAILNSMGVHLKIFGKEDHKISTLKKLIDIGLTINIDIGPSDSKEEISKILGCEGKSDVHFDENHFLNMKEEADTVNTMFENLTEDDKRTPAEPSKEIVTQLHMHQKQALNWMMMKEKGDQLPPFWELKGDVYHNNITNQQRTTKPRSIKGGILADEMGLGKTLTVISLIVTNPKKCNRLLDKVNESKKSGKEEIEVLEQKDEHSNSETEGQTQHSNAPSVTEEPLEEDFTSDHEAPALDPPSDTEETSEEEDVLSDYEMSALNTPSDTGEKSAEDVSSDHEAPALDTANDTREPYFSSDHDMPSIDTPSNTREPLEEEDVSSDYEMPVLDTPSDTRERLEEEDVSSDHEMPALNTPSDTGEPSEERDGPFDQEMPVLETDEHSKDAVTSDHKMHALDTPSNSGQPSEEDVSSDNEAPALNEVTDSDLEEYGKGGDICSEFEDQGKGSKFCSESGEQGKSNVAYSNLDELRNDADILSNPGKTKRNGQVPANTDDATEDDHFFCENDESNVLNPGKSQRKAKILYQRQTEDLEKEQMKGTSNAKKLLKRTRKKKSSKTTLIVAPLSVINVWQTQITQHVDPMYPLRVCTFHGRNRAEMASVLTDNDVVITSYDTLRTDAKTHRVLQQVRWFRVVLDEGHKIKNPSSKQTQAINSLLSERRWILSGTPIQNKIEELWSLISFLKVDTFSDIKQWKKIIVDPLVYGDGDAKTRVFHLVNFLALRRTKTSTINGEKIISLPMKRVHERVLVFSDTEREMYREFDRGCKQLIRRLIDERRHLHEIGIFYAALVRLRQLCCHPEIIPSKAKVGKVKLGRSLSEFDSTQPAMEKIASLLRLSENDCCSICLEEICVKEGMKAPVITDCDHVFCKVCIIEVIQQHGTCPNCRGGLTINSIMECPPEQLALRLERPELDKSVFSTKTTALMNDLLHLRENSPDVKSVIVSEFTTLLDVIEEPLKCSNFRFVRLDGKMTQKARAKSIQVFSSSEADSPTVMLLSLKAGGEGISLIAASHVFLLTPHWNPSTEDQCFDRCHRIGQTKDVTVIKYVVKDTIEERILSLQEQKKKLMDCAFNNNKGKPEKLGIDEIMTLLNIPSYGE